MLPYGLRFCAKISHVLRLENSTDFLVSDVGDRLLHQTNVVVIILKPLQTLKNLAEEHGKRFCCCPLAPGSCLCFLMAIKKLLQAVHTVDDTGAYHYRHEILVK